MSILKQQLAESIRELETIRQSIEYSSQLALRLAEEEVVLTVLEKKLIKEQRDVDVLQKEGIASLVRKIIGDREEKLTNEQEEYLQVSRQYTELFKSIELMRFELDVLHQKNDAVQDVEMKVSILLKEREKELILSDVLFADQVKYLNAEVSQHHAYIKKLLKLKSTGDMTFSSFTSLENRLNEARDQVASSKAGSALLVDDALEYARSIFQKARQQLSRFQIELKSLFPEMHLDTKINFDLFEKFADTAILAEFTFMEKINNSRKSVKDKKEQLAFVLNLLDTEYSESLGKLASIEEKRKKLILDAA